MREGLRFGLSAALYAAFALAFFGAIVAQASGPPAASFDTSLPVLVASVEPPTLPPVPKVETVAPVIVAAAPPVVATLPTPFDNGGPHITINGYSYPSKSLTMAHLRNPIHGGTNAAGWRPSRYEPFEQWTAGQLATIHDAHHCDQPPPDVSTTATTSYVSAPVVTTYRRPTATYATPTTSFGSNCPGGNCSPNMSTRYRSGWYPGKNLGR